MANDSAAIEAAIAGVTTQINSVEAATDRTEKQLQQKNLSQSDVAYYREKERQLREKEMQLREKERQLREEKRRLEEERVQSRPPLHPDRLISKMQAEMDWKFNKILDVVGSNDRATPQYSAAFVGNREQNRLKSEGNFTVFVGKDGEDAVLSADQVAKLAAVNNEHQVVAYLTPHLEEIVHNIATVKYSVFNSEEYKWIETSSETNRYNEKPDLIICDPAIIQCKPPFKISDDLVLQQMRQDTFKYGILFPWKLRDFIGLTCEAKQKIDNEGFGEVINYGAHLCFGKHASQTTRLLLFDKTGFWLVHTVKGMVANVQTCKWIDPGSKNLLRDFIRQPTLSKLLAEACQHLHLSIGTDSFLGAGAFGFVFKAVRHDGRCVALKLVSGGDGGEESVVRLEREAESMRAARKSCPGEVMSVEKEGFVKLRNGAVLLMSRIGDHYSKLSPQSIVNSLQTLHKNNIIHGDARLENVVCVDGKPCWIDFMDSRFLVGEVGKRSELMGLLDFVREKFGYNTEVQLFQ